MKIKYLYAAMLIVITAALLCGCTPSDNEIYSSSVQQTEISEAVRTSAPEASETAVPEVSEAPVITSESLPAAEIIVEGRAAYDMPEEFYTRLVEIIESYPHFLYYDISLAYRDIETGYTLTINPDKHYYPASVLKAPYMLYIYRLALSGQADLEQKLVYTEKYRREGTGVLKNMEYGTEFTVEELIGLCLEESDNSAFAMLRELYPEEDYEQYALSLGITHKDDAKGKNQPQLCCESALIFSQAIYDFIEENNPCSENLRYHMTHSRNAMIYGGEGSEIVRKYGWYEGYFHDMAVVYGENTYLLTIMTSLDMLVIDTREYDIFRDLSKLFAEYSDKLSEKDGDGDFVIINIPKPEGFEMTLPKDPYMLLSVVNMKLRDNYKSFDELCEDLDVPPEEISVPLEKLGYVYDEKSNQFATAEKEPEQT